MVGVDSIWTLSILLFGISGILGQGYYGQGQGRNPGQGYYPQSPNQGQGNNPQSPNQGQGTNPQNPNQGRGQGTNPQYPNQGQGGQGRGGATNFRDNDAKVLILGAGPAGLKAVKILMENGINDYIVLEGAAESGGKLKKINFGQPARQYETGAMWAYPPTKRLLDEYGVEYRKNNWESMVMRSDRAVDLTSQARPRQRALQNSTNLSKRLAREITNGRRSDVSMKTALAMYGWIDVSAIDHALEWFEFDFEEGVQSKDVSFYGRSQKNFEAHQQYFITNRNRGLFSDVIQRLDADHLRLSKIVTNIDQSRRDKRVTVTAKDGTVYTGDYALVTFSIGVLQRGLVTFTPPLPQWKTEQIFRYQMGTLDPIFLRFQRKFWGNEEWILHASERGGNRHYYPAFLNLEANGLFPRGTNTLVAFVTGEEASRLESLLDREVRAEVYEVLRTMYGNANVPNILEFHFERWGNNPFHFGSFSTWPVGAEVPIDAMERLQAHVGRVFFAQDASDNSIGTIWEVLKSMFGSANVPNILELYFERWGTNPLHYGSFSTWPIGADRPADARQRLAAHFGRLFFAQDATDQGIGTISGSVSAGEKASKHIMACINRRNCPRPYQPRNTVVNRNPGCGNNNQNNGNDGPRLVIHPLTIMLASIMSLALTSLMQQH